MAKTFEAPFPQAPMTDTAVCTAAATWADDNPAGVVELLTAGADGCVVTRVSAIPRNTVSATCLLLYVQKAGTTFKRLKSTALMPAQTVNTTTQNKGVVFEFSEQASMRLGAGDKLFAGIGVALAAGVVFSAEYTNY